MSEIGDRFKEGDDIDSQIILLPTAEKEQAENLDHVRGTLTLADDVSSTAFGTVLLLDLFYGGDGL